MKTLIAYYSYTANNQKLAYKLHKLLNCDLLKIEELKKRTGFTILMDLVFNRKPSIKVYPYYLKDYDHVIFIAPIWAGRIATPLKTFLHHEKSNIREYSFVTLCGGGDGGQHDKIQKELATLVSKEPLKVAELWINDLLSPKQKNTAKYTSAYRIADDDFIVFESQIQHFLDDVLVHEVQ